MTIARANRKSLAGTVLSRLAERREMLAVAESCTGGGLGRAITEIPGASEVFLGGVIAYADALKVSILGVPAAVLERHGAVSEETALSMAAGVRARADADWAVSITGIAGPGGGTVAKPVGTVWVGVAGPDGLSACGHLLTGDREAIRSACVEAALECLARRLSETDG